jgi:hypothetical protein
LDKMFSYDLSRDIFVLPPDVMLSSTRRNEVLIPRHDFSILRNGRRERFTPSEVDYAAWGMTWSKRETELDAMPAADMLRFLCDEIGDSFFASEDALRDLIEKKRADAEWEENSREWWHPLESELGLPYELSHRLDLFLQTRSWTHPRWDWATWQDSETARAQLQVFDVLARAIASGDLTEWNQQDASVFNTHWKHWAWRNVDAERIAEKAADELEVAACHLSDAERAAFVAEVRQAAQEPFEQYPTLFNELGLRYANQDDERLFLLGKHLLHAEADSILAWLSRQL